MTILDAANEELNADDQPDKDWPFLEMYELEYKRCNLQHTLRTIKPGHSDKLRLKLERLEKYMKKQREPGSKQWLNQVRFEAA